VLLEAALVMLPATASHDSKTAVYPHFERSVEGIAVVHAVVQGTIAVHVTIRHRIADAIVPAPTAQTTSTDTYLVVAGSAMTVETASETIVDLASVTTAVIEQEATGQETTIDGKAVGTGSVAAKKAIATSLVAVAEVLPRTVTTAKKWTSLGIGVGIGVAIGGVGSVAVIEIGIGIGKEGGREAGVGAADDETRASSDVYG
jgi:hypothetical protein